MCEIAVVDPERTSIEQIHQIAGKFHQEQGDGIGVVLVMNRGDSFEYQTYKSVHPHWQTLYRFLRRHLDVAWRVVIHGRYGTAGGVNRDNAHPIEVDCQHCDFDMVVHNGSVRRHRKIRPGLISQGHNFNTKVDSEILAHKVQELPESLDDHDQNTYSMRGNLHYLLFSEDGILARTEGKYDITDDFLMTCSRRDFKDAGLDFEYSRNKWALITPDDDEPEIETKEGSTYQNRYSSRNTSGADWESYTNNARTRNADDDDGAETHTIEYIDYSKWEHIIAIQAAPGVMKIIDKTSDQTEYVYANENPRLYYWYSPADKPENIDELQDLADIHGRVPPESARDTEQTQIEDFPQQRVQDAVTDETMRVIQEEIMTNGNVDEIAEIQDEVQNAVAQATNAAIETATTG